MQTQWNKPQAYELWLHHEIRTNLFRLSCQFYSGITVFRFDSFESVLWIILLGKLEAYASRSRLISRCFASWNLNLEFSGLHYCLFVKVRNKARLSWNDALQACLRKHLFYGRLIMRQHASDKLFWTMALLFVAALSGNSDIISCLPLYVNNFFLSF